jgi:hypothetical protein
MAWNIQETHLGRSRSAKQTQRTFYVTDSAGASSTASEADALTAFLASSAVPTDIDGHVRSDADSSVEELEAGKFLGTAVFKSIEISGQFQRPASFNITFDISGATQKITQALSHIATYPEGAEHFHGAINYNEDHTVEGTDIIASQLTYNVNYTFDDADVTTDFVNTLAQIVGSQNDAAFHGYEQGELLLTRVSGQKRNDGSNYWDISFGFLVSRNCKDGKLPNGQPFVIQRPHEWGGDITITEKFGWDYLWCYRASRDYTAADGSKVTRSVVVSVHIDQVYLTNDFSALGIGV